MFSTAHSSPQKLAGRFSDRIFRRIRSVGSTTIGKHVYVTYEQPNARAARKWALARGGRSVRPGMASCWSRRSWRQSECDLGNGSAFQRVRRIGGDTGGQLAMRQSSLRSRKLRAEGYRSQMDRCSVAKCRGLGDRLRARGTTTKGTPATGAIPIRLYFAAGITTEGGLLATITSAAATGTGDFT